MAGANPQITVVTIVTQREKSKATGLRVMTASGGMVSGGMTVTIESLGGAQDVGIAVEELGPEFVTDHKNRRRTGSGVFVGKGSAEEGRNTERFESTGSSRGARQFIGTAIADQVDLAPDQAEHVVESMVLLFEVDEGRCGEAPCSKLFGGKNGEVARRSAFL